MRHAEHNVGDYLLSHGHPDDIAITAAGQHVSYQDLRSMVDGLATSLTTLGRGRGARLAIIGANSPFWIASYLAVLRLNMVAVPLSHMIDPSDLRRHLDLLDIAAALIDTRQSRRLADVLPPDLPLITDATPHPARPSPCPSAPPCDPDADAVLMLTSGTTGRPRVVRITHRNIRANTDSILSVLRLRRDDRVLVVLPFFYCFGASLLHTHLSVGARLVLCDGLTFPETTLDLLEEQRCTVLAGVPSTFHLLLRVGGLSRRGLSSLRMIQQAGGPLPPAVLAAVRTAVPGADLFVMYGQTEATARLSILPPEALGEHAGSVGKGLPGVELRVLDDSGRPVPPGVQGEIYARGASISPGYLDDPANSAAKFTPDGLRTGDLAVIDDEGYISIVGRREDFIKSWGHRVSSQEIEAVALGMRHLSGAAAVGIPDPRAGEAITLFVTVGADAPVSPSEILAHCGDRLPRYMMPRTVLIVDALPLNANGKIAKARLRDQAMCADAHALPAMRAAPTG